MAQTTAAKPDAMLLFLDKIQNLLHGTPLANNSIKVRCHGAVPRQDAEPSIKKKLASRTACNGHLLHRYLSFAKIWRLQYQWQQAAGELP